MKYRRVAGFISVSVIAAALSGCQGAGDKGAEPQTLSIAGMEVVNESETEMGKTETELTAAESEYMEIDLAETESGDDAVAVLETSGSGVIVEESTLIIEDNDEYQEKEGIEDLQTEEQAQENQTEKPVVTQEQEDQTEEQTATQEKKDQTEEQTATQAQEDQTEGQTVAQTKENQTEKPAATKTQEESETRKKVEKETQKEKKSGLKETQRETQKTQKETQRETQMETQKETQRQTRGEKAETEENSTISVIAEPEAETAAKTETETESETEAETEEKIERESETEAKTELKIETESKTETESETEEETEAKIETESENEAETEAKTGSEMESETEAETEAKTETERESETEAETEAETEIETIPENDTETETEAEAGVRIVNDVVRVREQPSTDAAQIASMTSGMQVYAVREEGEWTQIFFETSEGIEIGYIKTEYLEGTENLYTVKETINVRKEASAESQKLGVLSAGDRVLVLDTAENGWVKIRYAREAGDDQEAYVMREFLEEIDPDSFRIAELAENQVNSETETDAETEEETGSETNVETEEEIETETGREAGENNETAGEPDGEESSESLTVPGLCTVNSFHVNVRKQPSTEADIIASLSNDMMVYAVENDGEWVRIFFESTDGVQEGYIKSEFLNDSDVENARIADLAKAKLQEEDSRPDDGTEALEETAPESEEAQNEDMTESGADASDDQTDNATETETDSESVAETEKQTETGTEVQTEAKPLELTEGIESQFGLMEAILPDAKKAGIIYSSGNENAQTQIEDYETCAKDYGVELTLKMIESDLDVDLAASELVGSVDCIFCMEDPLVDGLLQTVCAYANEMGIPVIGVNQTQMESGCLAAYEDGELHWNADEAAALGLDGQAPEIQ